MRWELNHDDSALDDLTATREAVVRVYGDDHPLAVAIADDVRRLRSSPR